MSELTPREYTLVSENTILSPFACLSSETKGRQREEEKCPLRTEFQRDRDRIIHSNAFVRLKQKTQVFLNPTGDHYRTRLTHTLEVSQIARTIARALRLNEDLTEAIALGHDLGHTPFGHAGEAILDEIAPNGFKHYRQSLRVVDFIEKDGKGLNLTHEVRDGILKHTDAIADTREGYVVRLADVIAFLNHDIEDAIRAGVISQNDLPKEALEILGETKSQRITSFVTDLVKNGAENIAYSPEVDKARQILVDFMYANVYKNPVCKSEEARAKVMIEKLYRYFLENPEKLPHDYLALADRFDKETAVCDYVAGMTDKYCTNLFIELYVPKGWNIY
ncbi:MAG: deoxyguanosinetriphosphate triphosphohydrolase [Oscillospiraceae bacterium]|nr:deoxyguanosinetriphosphate triphosphohydrolase [Oscillospiraceae bacterium]